MSDRYDDDGERLEATSVQRAVAIIATVLGVLGTGYGLFSLALLVVNGAMLSSVGAGGLPGGASGFIQIWTTVSLVMGGVLGTFGLILSLLAFASGLMGALTARFTALRWTAALIVAFDSVAYVLWPIVNYIASFVVMIDMLGGDAPAMLAISGVMMLAMMVISIALIAFWAWTFMACRPEPAAT